MQSRSSREGWAPEDLRGVALAVARSRGRRRGAGLPRRRAGQPARSGERRRPAGILRLFLPGSLVNRSPLVVAISTDGGAPVLAQAIRARIEALLPANFAQWAEAAREWRLAASLPSRRSTSANGGNFWERFADLALASAGRAPRVRRFPRRWPPREPSSETPARGHVILVGARPGEPDLLPPTAGRALQSADGVLNDRLTPPAVLELARREARRIDVGKRGPGRSIGQDEISKMLVDLAREGKTVVRLKGGDPGVFGRAHDEIEAARSAAGVPCTIHSPASRPRWQRRRRWAFRFQRRRARRIQFVTARDAGGANLPEGLEWRALVDADEATTAVYMGDGHAPRPCGEVARRGARSQHSPKRR